MTNRRTIVCAGAAALFALVAPCAKGQKAYDQGASDTEVVVGNTMPYSGPASSYSSIGKSEAAYFKKVNDEGGVNGRKIHFISLDDGYSPPKTVEMVRQLVEKDGVLLMFGSLGTATNIAVQKYLNDRKIPQLFVASGAARWNDPKNFPWTMGLQISYQTEGWIYARHILQTRPDGKIGVLYQNDDFGKDYLRGVKDGLGEKAAKMIVAEVSYETSDPTVDSQVVQLQASGANVFLNFSLPKFAAMAIRKAYDSGWKPVQYMALVSVSVDATLNPAGPDKAVGIMSAAIGKDPTDPQWQDDPGINEWRSFMKRYYPDGGLNDWNAAAGYGTARALVQVLAQCGDNLTRENVMKQAANLKNFSTGMNLPGIFINTSPTNYAPIQTAQLMRFDGKQWVRFGEIIGR